MAINPPLPSLHADTYRVDAHTAFRLHFHCLPSLQTLPFACVFTAFLHKFRRHTSTPASFSATHTAVDTATYTPVGARPVATNTQPPSNTHTHTTAAHLARTQLAGTAQLVR